MNTAISVSGLRKTYGRLTAVDGINFEVRTGEIFGLLGPNGAGKTTTIECLEGMRTPEEGRIRLLDLDPRATAITPGNGSASSCAERTSRRHQSL
jgi:ABC-2 type transport system ATP-binding protein